EAPSPPPRPPRRRGRIDPLPAAVREPRLHPRVRVALPHHVVTLEGVLLAAQEAGDEARRDPLAAQHHHHRRGEELAVSASRAEEEILERELPRPANEIGR